VHIRTALCILIFRTRNLFSVRVRTRTSTLSTLQEKRTILLLELRRLSPRTKTSFFGLQNPSIKKGLREQVSSGREQIRLVMDTRQDETRSDKKKVDTPKSARGLSSVIANHRGHNYWEPQYGHHDSLIAKMEAQQACDTGIQ
jgi:hypothetical protein